MDFAELQTFLTVVNERSFSRAATRLHRTQPAVSLAIRRLEKKMGEQLFDRSSNDGTLTDAGQVLRDYAERLVRLSEEAESSVRELRDLRRGRVLIGANEAAIPIILPFVATFQQIHSAVVVDVRRVHARHVAAEVTQGRLDFGVMTFQPADRRLRSLSIGVDEMVVLVYPSHPFAGRRKVTVAEWAKEPVVFHNDPSPIRERVVQLAEERGVPLNTRIALPTLDGIKLAVEMGLGVSLLPRRCVLAEIKRGQLVAVPIPEVRLPRQVRLVYRRARRLSRAAAAFLDVASSAR